MRELHELKERLIDELKEYGRKDLSAGSLEMIDKLAHATKNLCKIIESSEEGKYSYDGDNGHSERYSGRRDSMGRFSHKLSELMDEAPDDRSRDEVRRLMSRMGSM